MIILGSLESAYSILLVLIELFSLCVTAEALRAIKPAISLQQGRLTENFI